MRGRGMKVIAAAIGLAIAPPTLAQLTPPPGPPADTDRVREQADPRTPVGFFTTPGDATAKYVISQSGSYYLTANDTAGFTPIIRITAPDVTLDLNGFLLVGSSFTDHAILVEQAADRAVIHNGSITGTRGSAINAERVPTLVVRDVQIADAGNAYTGDPQDRRSYAINTGGEASIERVNIANSSAGIFAGTDIVVRDVIIRDVTMSGIYSVFPTTITADRCRFERTGDSGISGRDGNTIYATDSLFSACGEHGIDQASIGSIIQRCRISGADDFAITTRSFAPITIRDCSLVVNRGGIETLYEGSKVIDTLFERNRGIAIVSLSATRISGCVFQGNDQGVFVNGTGATIENNTFAPFNRFTFPFVPGVQLNPGFGSTVRNNTFEQVEVELAGNGNQFDGNLFRDAAFTLVGSPAETVFTRNRIQDSPGFTTPDPASNTVGPINDLDSPWANFIN